MKTKLGRLGTGLCLASLLTAASVQATIVLDEYGTPPGGGMLVVPSLLDTVTGMNTLAYLNPAVNSYLNSGWVAIFEPGGPQDAAHVSDIIHFGGNRIVGGISYNEIYFYSKTDPLNSLADQMPSAALIAAIIAAPGTALIMENAVDQAFYSPAAGQPGFVNGGPPVDFAFVSGVTPVPEPSTMVAGATASVTCTGGS
jgi:hypothetical protein